MKKKENGMTYEKAFSFPVSESNEKISDLVGTKSKIKTYIEALGVYSISAYGFMLVLASLLGFLIENVWIILTEGFIDNRNMNAPFLLGYGVMVLLIYFLMGTPQELSGILKFGQSWTKEGRWSLYFLTSFLVVCGAEITTGYLVEKFCRLYYWSYESLPLHITRYTSLPTSISFAFLILFFMGVVYTPVMRWLTQMDNRYLRIMSCLMVLLLMFDLVSCFFYMWNHQNFYYLWKVQILQKYSRY